MAKKVYTVARWVTHIGTFEIDENLQVLLDGVFMASNTTIPACKGDVQNIYNERRKSRAKELQDEINTINSMEVLIDSYREEV